MRIEPDNETPLEKACREARESMAEMLEAELRKLGDGQRLALGPLTFIEGDGSMKCEIRLLQAGQDLRDVPEARVGNWTVYEAPPRLRFVYENHRGEVAPRTVVAPRLFWGSSDWHLEPQWLIEAFDLDRGDMRTFALSDIAAIDEDATV